MNELELTNRSGQKIIGKLSKPQSNTIWTAVLQHGYSWVMQQIHILAVQDVFLKHGFQVFNFDTTNSFGKSDGHIRDARLWLHNNDFEDVTNWVKKQDRCVWKVLISWHSMWWYSVINYAQKYDVDFVVPISPVVSGELLHEAYQKNESEKYNKWKSDWVIYWESKTIPWAIKESPREVMEEYLDHDWLQDADKIKAPILLITWENDTVCPPEHIQQFYDALTIEDKSFEVIAWSPHTFRSKEHLESLTSIIDKRLSDNLSTD